MPLPTPSKNQKESEFISECMADPTMNREYPDNKRRAAICYSQYRRAKQRNKTKGSIEEPKWEDFSDSHFLII